MCAESCALHYAMTDAVTRRVFFINFWFWRKTMTFFLLANVQNYYVLFENVYMCMYMCVCEVWGDGGMFEDFQSQSETETNLDS